VRSQRGDKNPNCGWDWATAGATAIDRGCAEETRSATVPESKNRFCGIEFCISRGDHGKKGKCRVVCSKAATGAAAAVEVSVCATAGPPAEGVPCLGKAAAPTRGWSLQCPCGGYEDASNSARR
jgi:hypothetical protein